MSDIEKELATIETVCYNYKKNKSCMLNIFFSILIFVFLYILRYIVINNIDIGFPIYFINYSSICAIIIGIFGWLTHILEFYTTNIKLFNICKICMWGIELILSVIFLILLFINF